MNVEKNLRTIVAAARAEGMTVRAIASEVGVDPGTLKALSNGASFIIGKGGFNPTVSTIKGFEALGRRLSVGESSTSAFSPMPLLGLPDLGAAVESRIDRKSGEAHSIKAAISRPFVPLLASQLHKVELYCEQLRSRNGRLLLEDVDPEVVKYLAPDANRHIANAPARAEDATWLVWHRVPDWRGGVDLTGKRVSHLGDAEFHADITDDLIGARETGLPIYHAVYRSSVWERGGRPVVRIFYRLLLRVECPGESSKILWFTLGQNSVSPFNLFRDLVPV